MSGMLVVAFLTSCAALGLCVISLAIPYWIKSDVTLGRLTIRANSGLWRGCSGNDQAEICADITDPPSWLEATRAFMILGMLAAMGASCLGFLFWCVMKENRMIPLLAAVASVVAGGCMLVAFSIFADKNSAGSEYFHAGFALAVIAMAAAFVSAVFYFLARKAAS